MKRPPALSRPRLTYPDIPYGEMLARPATLFPERTAIVFRDTRLTFRELDGLVNAFANALRGLGIGRGDRVALFMTNRPEYVIAFFALARIGAVSSPMNPSYREREVAYQLADAGCIAVLTQPELVGLVDAVRPELPRLKHVIVGAGGPEMAPRTPQRSERPRQSRGRPRHPCRSPISVKTPRCDRGRRSSPGTAPRPHA